MFALQGEEDGPVVAAMLGVTNVSELCMWLESNNKVRTCNPHHTGRTVGGSSGGGGCVISAGGSPWGKAARGECQEGRGSQAPA